VDIFNKDLDPVGVVGGELRDAAYKDLMREDDEERELAETSADFPLTVKHLLKWVYETEGADFLSIKKDMAEAPESERCIRLLSVLLKYNAKIWNNIQSRDALEGFDPRAFDSTSEAYFVARRRHEEAMRQTRNKTTEELQKNWPSLSSELKTASGLRPGSSIVADHVSFKERLTTG